MSDQSTGTVVQNGVNYPSDKAGFDVEGYAVFRNAISPELAGEAAQHIDWLINKHPELRPEQLGHQLVAQDPFWVRLVSDPGLLDIAQQFIGPNIGLFASHYICKPPFDGQAVLWHQDGSYWPLDPMEVVTVWLAVDESVPENGCMRVIPRTQNMELQELVPRNDVANVLKSGMADELVNESEAVDIILDPGDVSIHHPNLIHGSKPNNSPKRRAGLTIRYIPTSTRITKQPWPCSFLLRGNPVEGVNEWLDYPKYVEGECMPFSGCDKWA